MYIQRSSVPLSSMADDDVVATLIAACTDARPDNGARSDGAVNKADGVAGMAYGMAATADGFGGTGEGVVGGGDEKAVDGVAKAERLGGEGGVRDDCGETDFGGSDSVMTRHSEWNVGDNDEIMAPLDVVCPYACNIDAK